MKRILFIMLLNFATKAFAQTNIVPMPVDMKIAKGSCILKQPIGFILVDTEDDNGNDGEDLFKKYLTHKYKITKFIDGDTHSYGLPTEIFYTSIGTKKPKGYYELEITGNKIYIRGTALGKFYAFETLKQLITVNTKKEIVIPNCKIKDYPRFAYRGMHLDVCRHFFPVSYIKKYIDFLAAYKFNTFHWHLTDDQGWRIEIKKYPLLTKVGGYRNGTIIGNYPGTGNDSIHYGGYYTQAQIKDIVKYATERNITIIPEIEMPGHSSAAIAAYPQLSCFPDENTEIQKNTVWAGSATGKQVQQTWGVFTDVYAPTEYTFKFLENVLDEVMKLFPSKYIHIGGDECPKENWKRSAFCQQLIKDKNLKDEHGLQSYFIQRIEKYVNSKGKDIIGWDEILEGGLAKNATVMSWRGEEGGIAAAKENHNVIMTPGDWCYFDQSQSIIEDSITIGGYLPLEKVYNYEPIPDKLNETEAKFILGAQANLWTEYIGNERKLEYMLFPRIAALAEVLWSPKEKRNWTNFQERIPGIFKSLDDKKINYSTAYYNLQTTILPTENYDGILLKIESNIKNGLIKYSTANTAEKKYNYDGPILIKDKNTIAANFEVGGKNVSSLIQKIDYNKATGKKITLGISPSKNYSGDGAFTLVNGIQNNKGLNSSFEFLGYLATDADAIIDLGSTQNINEITLHAFEQKASWIYRPSAVLFYTSNDGINFILADSISAAAGNKNLTYQFNKQIETRFIKIVAKNYGIIPAGQPGAGKGAWLFLDEIEVK